MGTRPIGILAAVALALVGCGDGGSPQDEVADMILDEDELQLDEGCVREAASRLSDEDARTILDAGPEGDPVLSEEARGVADSLFGCFDTDAFVDQLVAEMGGTAEGLDVECLKEAFRSLDPATFEDDPAFATAMLDCLELDG